LVLKAVDRVFHFMKKYLPATARRNQPKSERAKIKGCVAVSVFALVRRIAHVRIGAPGFSLNTNY